MKLSMLLVASMLLMSAVYSKAFQLKLLITPEAVKQAITYSKE